MSEFAIGGNESLFRIKNAELKNDWDWIYYTDEFGGCLEVSVDNVTGEMIYIDYTSLGIVEESNVIIPQKKDMQKFPYVVHSTSSSNQDAEKEDTFSICFDKKNMEIKFGSDRVPNVYSETDRMLCFYDEDLRPTSIIITDLSEEEYKTLQLYAKLSEISQKKRSSYQK